MSLMGASGGKERYIDWCVSESYAREAGQSAQVLRPSYIDSQESFSEYHVPWSVYCHL